MSLVAALTDAVLPVLSVAAVGYLLGRLRDVDVDPLNTVTIYVLTPALIFHSLATTSLGGDVVAALLGGVALFTLVMVALGEGVARVLDEPPHLRSAFVLTSTFPNAGNFGIPLSAFAFGAVGRSTAVLYIAGQAVLMYTLGVYVASRGQASEARDAVASVFRLPLVYAVVVAWTARWLGAVPPEGSALMRTVQLTGDAAIPVMLLLLGIQLANATSGLAVGRVWPSGALKLLVAPVVGLGVATTVGLSGDVARVFVLECAAPAAVTPLLLTIEFGRESVDGVSAADYVSTAVFATTVAGVATVTVLVAVLQSGAVI